MSFYYSRTGYLQILFLSIVGERAVIYAKFFIYCVSNFPLLLELFIVSFSLIITTRFCSIFVYFSSFLGSLFLTGSNICCNYTFTATFVIKYNCPKKNVLQK